MNQELIDRCPFREKTASRRLYLALARSGGQTSKSEIARAAHLTVAKTATLLTAYVNPMHRAPMDRLGVRLVRTTDGGYTLESCKPKPNAKRPARGEAKKKPAKTAKKRKIPTLTTNVASVRKVAVPESGEGRKSPRNGREKRHAAQTEAESPNAPAPVEENTPSEPPI